MGECQALSQSDLSGHWLEKQIDECSPFNLFHPAGPTAELWWGMVLFSITLARPGSADGTVSHAQRNLDLAQKYFRHMIHSHAPIHDSSLSLSLSPSLSLSLSLSPSQSNTLLRDPSWLGVSQSD